MIELSFITRDSLNPNHPFAGVRLQSKQDSHCESCFVFGLTPSLRLLRRKTKACADATLQWWSLNPQGFKRIICRFIISTSLRSIFSCRGGRWRSVLRRIVLSSIRIRGPLLFHRWLKSRRLECLRVIVFLMVRYQGPQAMLLGFGFLLNFRRLACFWSLVRFRRLLIVVRSLWRARL